VSLPWFGTCEFWFTIGSIRQIGPPLVSKSASECEMVMTRWRLCAFVMLALMLSIVTGMYARAANALDACQLQENTSRAINGCWSYSCCETHSCPNLPGFLVELLAISNPLQMRLLSLQAIECKHVRMIPPCRVTIYISPTANRF